jgi:hypothetical protein
LALTRDEIGLGNAHLLISTPYHDAQTMVSETLRQTI